MFNKETEYAMRGLVYIQAQNNINRKPGIIEIAREIDAPQFFTGKTLQRMVKNGFVSSTRGKGGGFFFDKEKADLPIMDLINAIEGDSTLTGCGFGFKKCDCTNPCPLHERYAPIRKAINDLVTTETIQSLAERYAKLKDFKSLQTEP